MRLRLRRLATVLAVVVTVGGWPGIAAAHNGVGAAFKGAAGRYLVYAYDGYLLDSGRVEYKLVLLNAETKDPVYDVQTTASATPATGGSPTDANVSSFGNITYYDLPNPYPKRWLVQLRLSGPLGSGHTEFHMHGIAPVAAPPVVEEDSGGGPPWGLVVSGIGVAVLVVLAVLGVLHRRRTES